MPKALKTKDQDAGWLVRSPSRLQAAVFILVGAVSLLGVFGVERAQTNQRHAALERNAAGIAAALRQLDTEHDIYLRASAALFSSRTRVTAQDFAQLQNELDFDQYRQGSLGVGWAPRVAARQPDTAGRLHPALTFPISFLNPADADNAAAIGYDMYAEPIRRAAMDQAAAVAGPVATGRVQLVQDHGHAPQPGFLIYMPVFSRAPSGITGSGITGAGITGTQRAFAPGPLKGFVFMPFRAQSLLTLAGNLSSGERIGVAAYDGRIAPDRLMASLSDPAATGSAAPVAAGDNLVERVTVAHRPWLLMVHQAPVVGLSGLSQIIILSGMIVAVLLAVLIRMTYQKINEERQTLAWKASEAGIRNSLTRELNHRVKNTLATVLSIVTLTRRRETDLDSYVESLGGRIRALSATHDLLTSSDWASIELRQIIAAELAPYLGGNEDHIQLDGPEIRLAPNDALTLGLAVHELATNAAKYGALSVLSGHITIHWVKLSNQIVEICWQESGGPPVAKPSKRGFGRELIEKILARELDSPVELNFAPDGLQCVFRVPLRQPASFVLRAVPQARR